MNNAPPAATMPAAGTQALLSIRPSGQRLAAREVLAGRDRLERLAPDRGERLAARLPAWDRSSRRPSAAVHVLSAHRAAEDRDARTYRGRRRRTVMAPECESNALSLASGEQYRGWPQSTPEIRQVGESG